MKDLINKILKKLNTSISPSHIKDEDFLLLWNSIKAKEHFAEPEVFQSWFEWQQKWSSEEKIFINQFSQGHFLQTGKQLRKVTKVTFQLENNLEFKIFKNSFEIASTENSPLVLTQWKNSLTAATEQYFANWRKLLSARKLALISEDFELAHLNEEKALQWLRGTFHVLEGALEKTKNNKEHFITSHILMGQLPLQDDYILQLTCFNVEILCKLNLNDQQQLFLLAYDLKEKEKLTPELAKNPVLKASIVYKKEELFQIIETFFEKVRKTSF